MSATNPPRSLSPGPARLLTPVPKRTTLGFLVDTISDEFQADLFEELKSEAQRARATLLVISDRQLGLGGSSPFYDFLDTTDLDALIVSTATLEGRVGHDQVEALARRFRRLPQVSIGSPLPGESVVLLDNTASMQAQVEHLLKAHNCKRLAFATGPKGSSEAEARWVGFAQALEAAGIEAEPSLRVEGDFSFESGRAAARIILERAKDIDAIVAANDEMALGVLAELEQQGRHVPDEIRVVGFDDIPGAASSRPPLSTQRQPFQELARTAIALAIRAAQGDRQQRRVVLHTVPVFRRSCGCVQPDNFAVQAPTRPRRTGPEQALMHQRPALAAAIVAAGAPLINAEDAEQLVDALVAGLLGKSPYALATAWQTLIERAPRTPAQLERFQSVVTAFRTAALPSIGELGNMATRAETAFHECRVLLTAAMRQAGLRQHALHQRQIQIIGQLGQAVASARSPTKLAKHFSIAAKELGLTSSYVWLGGIAGAPAGFRALGGTAMPGGFDVESAPLRLAAILPASETGFMLAPLFHGDSWFGLLLLELGTLDPKLLELLAAQLSVGIAAVTAPQSK